MGLGDAALPRFYAVRLLQCNSPAFSLPIMPAGRRRSAPLPSVVLDGLDRPDAAIHPTAWKEGSQKFACRILHSLSPTPLESPLQAPCIPEDSQAPICDCYDGWVFLGVQTEDRDEIIEAVPCCRRQ